MRFEPVPDQTRQYVQDAIDAHFSELSSAYIEMVYNTKKSKSGGKYVFQKLQKPSEIIRYLTINDEMAEGIDLILILDKLVFEAADDEDKKRIVNKALCHATADFEKDYPYGVRKFTNDDFIREQELNNDLHWETRILNMAESLYDED